MEANDTHAPTAREVVGTFASRESFEAAVAALLQAGFSRGALSVLSSHDSLELVQGHQSKPWREALVALAGEIKYEGPLVAAGLIALAAGPVGAALAALVAAGVGGVAAKEFLDEISAVPDSADFARALEAGSIILWVLVADQLEEEKAKRALDGVGAANLHTVHRKG
ncbi:Cysteine synthase [Magnetospirillum sp. LM-5]|uniref:hypothetical protein n=1 Tax=Magnetospirillum sp. LM-5 TaxID=2681466 RepID=UPI001380356C|nr:hypothetical protein [Magnetospirillum sp. LM-5]CAA7617539.1 Cysteine synthase [Magnetospirillum sp. LM-5]